MANSRAGQDKNIGKITSKGISLIDYAVCSPELFNIDDFVVLEMNKMYSDIHCPIT